MRNNEPAIESPLVGEPQSTSELSHGAQHLPQGESTRHLSEPPSFITYEFIDSRELARRLTVPTSWIRDQVRARSEDPLPHVNLGKYVRFLWGSPALELWIQRRIVVGNNRCLGRTRRKEQE